MNYKLNSTDTTEKGRIWGNDKQTGKRINNGNKFV